MNFSQKQIIIIGAILAVVALVALLVFFNRQPSGKEKISLLVWGFDKGEVFSPVIGAYKQLRPNVEISYKEIKTADYENYLLGALASGQGPDVFPIYNRQLGKLIKALYPASPSQLSAGQVQDLFPAEVETDFGAGVGTAQEQIFALPLYFDTLALIYNKDLFDQGGVVGPPATWSDFEDAVAKLRAISPNGEITRAGAAIGGSQKTITNAVDVLNNLIFQNGTTMLSGNNASFASENGANAFNFYLQFANPSSNYYTWNDSQPNDFDGFAAGKTAMVFGYGADVAKIKNKSPFLRMGIAPMPQTTSFNSVNYAYYWGLAVSKQSRNAAAAWNFVVFAATNSQAASAYSSSSGKPPALRDLIGQKISDPSLGVFAKQALTARSWYQVDERKIKNIFDNAISTVLNTRADPRRTLEQAQTAVTQLMQQGNQ